MSETTHAKVPGSETSENGYLGACACQPRGDAWPCRNAPAPALTAEEARTVARFDAAPVPPEVVAASVLIGDAWIAAASREQLEAECARLSETARFNLRRAWSAEEAVKRVEALAEEWLRKSSDSVWHHDVLLEHADQISAALASPAPAPHVHGAWCHPSADGCPDDLR